MKHIILTLVFAFIPITSVFAEDKDLVSCEQFEQMARTIMDGRLSGVSMSAMMAVPGGSELSKLLIIEAYEKPKYSSEERKKEAISEFGNQIYLQCIKSRSKK